MNKSRRATLVRWLKFNAVGAAGIVLQLAVLFALKSGLHVSYLMATAVAVEAAVVHNFLWHERFTWPDRVQPSWRESLPRLLRFNVTTGVVSIAGNIAITAVLVGAAGWNFMAANGIAIVACSLLNFVVSDRYVFEK